MNRTMYVLAILLSFLGCQVNDPSQEAGIDRVRVHAPELITVHRGTEGKGVVRLEIRDGFHVQANPVPLPYLIPTELELDDPPFFTVKVPAYPSGAPYSLHGSPDTLVVYDGLVTIPYIVSVPDTAERGDYEVQGLVTYQTCDDRMCFPPVKEPVMVHLRVF